MIRSSAVAAALLWAFSGSAASVVQQGEVEDLNDCVREGPDAYCLMEAFGEAAELLEQREWQAADALFNAVRARAERSGLPQSFVINVDIFRASSLLRQQRYQETTALLRAIRRRAAGVLGRQHPLSGSILILSADLALAERRYADAASHYTRALAIGGFTRALPESELARIRVQLAQAQLAAGRPERAQASLRTVLDGNETGDMSDRTALVALGTRARALRDNGRLAEAEREADAALRRSISMYGERHADTALLYHELGIIQNQLHKWEAAENSLRAAMSIRRQLFPARSIEIAGSALSLSCVVFGAQERLELRREALAIYRSLEGDDSQGTAVAYLEVARSLSEFGRLAEARGMGLRGFAIFQRAAAPDQRRFAGAHITMGTIMRRAGDLPAAEALLRKGVALQRQLYEATTHNLLYDEALVAGVWLERGSHPREAYARLAEVMPRLVGPVAEQAATSVNLTNEIMVYRPQLIEQLGAAWSAAQSLPRGRGGSGSRGR